MNRNTILLYSIIGIIIACISALYHSKYFLVIRSFSKIEDKASKPVLPFSGKIISWNKNKEETTIHTAITNDPLSDIENIINVWATIHQNQGFTFLVESIACGSQGLIISFLEHPFHSSLSLYEQWSLFNTLIKTINNFFPLIEWIDILEKQKTIESSPLRFFWTKNQNISLKQISYKPSIAFVPFLGAQEKGISLETSFEKVFLKKIFLEHFPSALYIEPSFEKNSPEWYAQLNNINANTIIFLKLSKHDTGALLYCENTSAYSFFYDKNDLLCSHKNAYLYSKKQTNYLITLLHETIKPLFARLGTEINPLKGMIKPCCLIEINHAQEKEKNVVIEIIQQIIATTERNFK